MGDLHPLQIDLVLDNLFGFCPFDDLKNCSRVCQKWRRKSLYEVREKGVLKVGYMTLPFPSTFYPINDPTIRNANHKWEMMYEPFRTCKLQLEGWNWTMATTDILKSRVQVEMITHLELCKGLIPIAIFNDLFFSKMVKLETLKMTEAMVYSPNDNRGLGLVPNPQPKLIPLTMINRTIRTFEFDINVPRCWYTTKRDDDDIDVARFLYEFLPKLLNLEELVISYPPNYSTAGRDIVTKMMKLLREKDRIISVKKLEVFCRGGRPIMLREGDEMTFIRSFPLTFPVLEHLRLDICSNWRPQQVKDVLQALSGTLRVLAVARKGHKTQMDSMAYKVHFEHLEEVMMLKDSSQFDNLRFLNMVDAPNLKKLTLNSFCHLRIYPHRFKSVEVLDMKINIDPYYIKAELIKRFARSMPHLKQLSVAVRKEGFRYICGNFPGLRVLNIYGTRAKTENNYRNMVEDGIDNDAITGATIESFRLANLKELKEFRLKASITNNKLDLLTDKAVFEGFLHLPTLKILGVYLAPISQRARTALEEKRITFDTRWVENMD